MGVKEAIKILKGVTNKEYHVFQDTLLKAIKIISDHVEELEEENAELKQLNKTLEANSNYMDGKIDGMEYAIEKMCKEG